MHPKWQYAETERKNRKEKQNNRRKHEWNTYVIENKILRN